MPHTHTHTPLAAARQAEKGEKEKARKGGGVGWGGHSQKWQSKEKRGQHPDLILEPPPCFSFPFFLERNNNMETTQGKSQGEKGRNRRRKAASRQCSPVRRREKGLEKRGRGKHKEPASEAVSWAVSLCAPHPPPSLKMKRKTAYPHLACSFAFRFASVQPHTRPRSSDSSLVVSRFHAPTPAPVLEVVGPPHTTAAATGYFR